jgi:hypothetical protein
MKYYEIYIMKYCEILWTMYKYVCYLKDFEMIETSDQKYQPPLAQDSIYSVWIWILGIQIWLSYHILY